MTNAERDERLAITNAILTAIKRPDLAPTYSTEDVEDGVITIGGMIEICRTEIEKSTILGPKKTPGWLVYTWRTVSNYPHSPDDVDMVELADVESFDLAVLNAVFTIMQQEAEGRPLTPREKAEQDAGY